MPRLCCCFSGGGSADKRSKVSSSGEATKDNAKASASSFPTGKNLPLSPVLVELFTSQGCSSCPPADLLISKLGQEGCGAGEEGEGEGKVTTRVPIIVLAYHVDYWDYLGWKDPFGNSRWSSRQRAYGEALQQDSIYTPEAVVQGRTHCIAANDSSLTSLIVAAPRFPAPDVRASFSRPSLSDMEVSLNVSVKTKIEGSLDVWVAIVENGQVTDCTKGENRGRVLTNDFVVRGLEKACSVQNVQQIKKPLKGQVNLKLWESYSRAKCSLIVFLQNASSMEVYGVQAVELPEDA